MCVLAESPPDGKERGEAGEDEEGGGGGGGGVGGSWLAVLTLEYYQGFFDVTTKQVRPTLVHRVFTTNSLSLSLCVCVCVCVCRCAGEC